MVKQEIKMCNFTVHYVNVNVYISTTLFYYTNYLFKNRKFFDRYSNCFLKRIFTFLRSYYEI